MKKATRSAKSTGAPKAAGDAPTDGEKAARPPKQAVVIIHGMGEQRPMETLRDFVRAVWESDPNIEVQGKEPGGINPFWMAPDTRTGSTEVDRATTGPTVKGYRVDFFELYWADIMVGTSWQHLRSWLFGLLFRWPLNVPRRVVAIWLLLWVITIAVFSLLAIAGGRIDFVSDVVPEAVKTTANEAFGGVTSLLSQAADWLGINRLGTFFVTYQAVIAKVSGFAVFALFLLSRGRELPRLRWRMSRFNSVAVSWALLIVGAVGIGAAVWQAIERLDWSVLLWLAGIAIPLLLSFFLLPYFGDVARYVDAQPANVQKRSEVRERGLALMRALHGRTRDGQPMRDHNGKQVAPYDRIIVVGHSLGSIIAFDILQKFWAEAGPIKKMQPSGKARTALINVDDWLGEHHDDPRFSIRDYQEMQFAAFRELAGEAPLPPLEYNLNWRISDFVTLGSPLGHADFLVAKTQGHFRELVEERLVSQCPPYPYGEQGRERIFFPMSGVWSNSVHSDKADSSATALHHASMFAVTRWTNIFDQRRWVMFGDFISGSVRDFGEGAGKFAFGRGIREMKIRIRRNHGFLKSLFTHTDYWNIDSDAEILSDTNCRAKDLPTANDPDGVDKSGRNVKLLRSVLDLNGFTPAGGEG